MCWVSPSIDNHPKESGMINHSIEDSQHTHPGIPLVAKVLCEMSNGSQIRLFATELTLGSAFILAMKPPPFGETINVTIYPIGLSPLPSIEARVISARIDPANAERSGFEIVFLHLDEIVLKKLSHAVSTIKEWLDCPKQRHLRAGAERRRHPRVPTDLNAYIEIEEGKSYAFQVENISMSGAKLIYPENVPTSALGPGHEIELAIICGSIPEYIRLKAQVVRLTHKGEKPGVGVHFIDLDDISERRIEGLILEALTGDNSWVSNS